MLIPLRELKERHGINPTGVIHVGANEGQELAQYYENGIERGLFIEAIPDVFRKLQQNINDYPNTASICACISDVDGRQVTFHVANNNGQSSSMLDFGTHRLEHPSVKFTHDIILKTRRLDTLIPEYRDYDMIVMDIQGAELLALKGMGDMLNHFKYAYLEVNEKPLYKGCALVGQIDNYLGGFGFARVETKMTKAGWGDALYVRTDNDIQGTVKVPIEFRRRQHGHYPEDNLRPFEEWYFDNFKGPKSQNSDRLYLPIFWTAYYCNNRYGKDTVAMKRLTDYLRALDRSKKYYTIVQYDDGILHGADIADLDIKVFTLSGKTGFWPKGGIHNLPLLCEAHKYRFDLNRDIFASFIGRKNTHEIRKRINCPGAFIPDHRYGLKDFCEIMARSVFALCPRGYGITSFRISESIQYGAIPVYISDEFAIPYDDKRQNYLINITDPSLVGEVLNALTKAQIYELQRNVERVKSDFTYQGALRFIDSLV